MTRLGYTAELGYELWVDRDRALELWDALIEAGTPAGMKVIGMVCLDLFRIEGGFIIGGDRVRRDRLAVRVRPRLVGRPRQGRLPGARRLPFAIVTRPTLRLTSVVLEGGGDAASGAPLSIDGREVGLVTQAVESPHLGGKTLGLAKIDKDLREPGTAVVATVEGEPVPGEIVRHPVYDPERKRVKES